MQDPSIQERVLTELDHARLVSLMARLTASGKLDDAAEAAYDLLDSVLTVPAPAIAPDVVTMRSRIRLRGQDGQDLDLTLAYPDEADAGSGRISVLSPLGLSLIGCHKGQQIQWHGPDRSVRRGMVADIPYQPEAAGDYGT